MKSIQNPEVASKFRSCPSQLRRQVLSLRKLILTVAAEIADIDGVEETLKWSEPSHLTTGGSTVRIGWKASRPDHYGLYFNCNTKLVDTFRELYGDSFRFEGNRAIIFNRQDDLPTERLQHCIALSLQYHKLKHLPLLGA